MDYINGNAESALKKLKDPGKREQADDGRLEAYKQVHIRMAVGTPISIAAEKGNLAYAVWGGGFRIVVANGVAHFAFDLLDGESAHAGLLSEPPSFYHLSASRGVSLGGVVRGRACSICGYRNRSKRAMMVSLFKGVREGSPLPKKKGSIGMKLKKILGVFALSAVLVCSLGGVVGCSNSEQMIRQGTAEMLDHYKNIDETVLEEASAALSETEAKAMGLTYEEMLQSMLDGFDYTIDSVNVDGDTAEAVVTITSKNLQGMTDEVEKLQSEMMSNTELQKQGTDALLKWYGEKMMEYMNNAPIETHEPLTLDYVLKDKTWELTSSSQKALENFITA